eukprot:Clim_evm36s253 gene=Clim_evmTU36s253
MAARTLSPSPANTSFNRSREARNESDVLREQVTLLSERVSRQNEADATLKREYHSQKKQFRATQDQYFEQLRGLQRRSAALESALEAEKAAVAKLEYEKHAIETTMTRTRAQVESILESAAAKENTLATRLSKLEKAFQEVQEDAKQAIEEVSTSKNQEMKDLKDAMEKSMESAMDEAYQKLNECYVSISDMTKQMGDLEKVLAMERTTHVESKKNDTDKIRKLNAESKTLRSKNDGLLAENAVLKREAEKAKHAANDWKQRHHSLQERHEEVVKQSGLWKKKFETIEVEKTESEMKISKEVKSLKLTNEQLKPLRAENNKLNEELKSVRETATKNTVELAKAREHVRTLKDQYDQQLKLAEQYRQRSESDQKRYQAKETECSKAHAAKTRMAQKLERQTAITTSVTEALRSTLTTALSQVQMPEVLKESFEDTYTDGGPTQQSPLRKLGDTSMSSQFGALEYENEQREQLRLVRRLETLFRSIADSVTAFRGETQKELERAHGLFTEIVNERDRALEALEQSNFQVQKYRNQLDLDGNLSASLQEAEKTVRHLSDRVHELNDKHRASLVDAIWHLPPELQPTTMSGASFDELNTALLFGIRELSGERALRCQQLQQATNSLEQQDMNLRLQRKDFDDLLAVWQEGQELIEDFKAENAQLLDSMALKESKLQERLREAAELVQVTEPKVKELESTLIDSKRQVAQKERDLHRITLLLSLAYMDEKRKSQSLVWLKDNLCLAMMNTVTVSRRVLDPNGSGRLRDLTGVVRFRCVGLFVCASVRMCRLAKFSRHRTGQLLNEADRTSSLTKVLAAIADSRGKEPKTAISTILATILPEIWRTVYFSRHMWTSAHAIKRSSGFYSLCQRVVATYNNLYDDYERTMQRKERMHRALDTERKEQEKLLKDVKNMGNAVDRILIKTHGSKGGDGHDKLLHRTERGDDAGPDARHQLMELSQRLDLLSAQAEQAAVENQRLSEGRGDLQQRLLRTTEDLRMERALQKSLRESLVTMQKKFEAALSKLSSFEEDMDSRNIVASDLALENTALKNKIEELYVSQAEVKELHAVNAELLHELESATSRRATQASLASETQTPLSMRSNTGPNTDAADAGPDARSLSGSVCTTPTLIPVRKGAQSSPRSSLGAQLKRNLNHNR